MKRAIMPTLHHLRGYLLLAGLVGAIVTRPTFAAPCGRHADANFDVLLKEAAQYERSGNSAKADGLMARIKQMAAEDLSAQIARAIPDPQDQYCAPNPTTEYIDCLLKLIFRAASLGVDPTLGAKGMERAKEATDLWTTQFSKLPPPKDASVRCTWYLSCLMKALAQRELFGISNQATDSLLNANVDQVLSSGCNPCSVTWSVTADVAMHWKSSDDTVSIQGKAQWDDVYIILDREALEEKCATWSEEGSRTFPFTRTGGSLPASSLQLLDGDETFAQMITNGDLALACENTDDHTDMELRCYIGFDNHGEAVRIPMASHLAKVRKRRPFTVTETVTNAETPSYSARFTISFTPVW